MNKSFTHRRFQATLILFLLVFTTSCQWRKQDDSSNRQPKDAPKQKTQWIDPLFEIEGQLCQHLRVIYQDRHGDLWFGTNVYGLIRYNGDSLEYFNRKNGFDYGRITAILEDDDGVLWIGSADGLLKYDGKSFTKFTEEDGLINNETWSVIIDSNGLFWIGTNEGVCKFDGKTFTAFPISKPAVKDTTSMISYNRISSILEDKQGRYWFGTDGFGISRFDPEKTAADDENSFTHLTTANGLPDNNISDIFQDSNGDIWIGTMFGGVSRFDGSTFHNLNQNGTLEGVEAGSFYEDKNGDLWFAVEHQGVYHYDGNRFTNYNKDDGLLTGAVICIYQDRDERFWLGGWLGLFRFDGKKFFPVTKNGPWN